MALNAPVCEWCKWWLLNHRMKELRILKRSFAWWRTWDFPLKGSRYSSFHMHQYNQILPAWGWGKGLEFGFLGPFVGVWFVLLSIQLMTCNHWICFDVGRVADVPFGQGPQLWPKLLKCGNFLVLVHFWKIQSFFSDITLMNHIILAPQAP